MAKIDKEWLATGFWDRIESNQAADCNKHDIRNATVIQAIESTKSNTTKMAANIPHGIHEDKMPYSFLSFPPEIRNLSYRELLVYDGITPEVKSHTHNYEVDTDFREADPYWSGCYRIRQCPKPRGLLPVDPDEANEVELGTQRLQLNVIKHARNSILPVEQPRIFAKDILSIFSTCKQIHAEARTIFWAENSFVFQNACTMYDWIRGLGEPRRRLVTTVGNEARCNPQWSWYGNLERSSYRP